MPITWSWWKLADADPFTLFAYLRLRSDVFIVEQHCAYADMDDGDLVAWHLTGHDADGLVVAGLRLLPPGARCPDPSLGRVVIAPKARGNGSGHLLIAEALRKAAAEYPGHGHEIEAQAHLRRFYARHGFAPVGEEFLEDGIPHITMKLTADQLAGLQQHDAGRS
jgi:ElaA protein